MERRQIRFHGRVQGVGFRATARAVAAGFPVSGWVRNEPDGTVLMEVQGPRDQVEACLFSLRQSMRRNISFEAAATLPVLSGEDGFHVRR